MRKIASTLGWCGSVLGALLLASACGDSGDAGTTLSPAGTWPVESAAEHGFDPARLEAAARFAQEDRAVAVLVVHEGAIVFERYFDDLDQDTQWQVYSVTKSFASTLVGIAARRGLLDLDEPASRYIPEWLGTSSEGLPIRQLMTGDSGRFWEFNGDFPGLGVPMPDDLTTYAIGRGHEFEPGTTWQYNQMAIQCLDRVLTAVTGQPTATFAQEALFDPLGMTSTRPGLDRTGQMTLAWGITSTARDLARLGLLYLHGGRWDGEQILAQDFVRAATSTANPVSGAYGYLWWVNTEAPWLEPVTLIAHEGGAEDRTYPDAPLDLFVASGNLGQGIIVSPSEDLIIVRLGRGQQRDFGRSYNDLYREVAAARVEVAR